MCEGPHNGAAVSPVSAEGGSPGVEVEAGTAPASEASRPRCRSSCDGVDPLDGVDSNAEGREAGEGVRPRRGQLSLDDATEVEWAPRQCRVSQ